MSCSFLCRKRLAQSQWTHLPFSVASQGPAGCLYPVPHNLLQAPGVHGHESGPLVKVYAAAGVRIGLREDQGHVLGVDPILPQPPRQLACAQLGKIGRITWGCHELRGVRRGLRHLVTGVIAGQGRQQGASPAAACAARHPGPQPLHPPRVMSPLASLSRRSNRLRMNTARPGADQPSVATAKSRQGTRSRGPPPQPSVRAMRSLSSTLNSWPRRPSPARMSAGLRPLDPGQVTAAPAGSGLVAGGKNTSYSSGSISCVGGGRGSRWVGG